MPMKLRQNCTPPEVSSFKTKDRQREVLSDGVRPGVYSYLNSKNMFLCGVKSPRKAWVSHIYGGWILILWMNLALFQKYLIIINL